MICRYYNTEVTEKENVGGLQNIACVSCSLLCLVIFLYRPAFLNFVIADEAANSEISNQ